MGKKKTPQPEASDEKASLLPPKEEKPAEGKGGGGAEAKPAEEEDPPIVKQLKEIDDRYLAIEREYEKEAYALQRKYTEQQQPLLEERGRVLREPGPGGGGAPGGTPALGGFWLQAMKNLPALEEHVKEWDEPVLEYLSDVTKAFLDKDDIQKGFKLSFHFAENPYFSNDVLWKEYHTEEGSPYTGEIETTEIKVSEIEWRPGKNVTVATVKKKKTGGGAKKNRQAKEKEEPRESFFRDFFRNLRPDMPLPDEIERDSDMDDGEDEEILNCLMEADSEVGNSVRDQLIPYAVRWYTGEADPADSDDEDDDEDDDDDEDEEEDDDDDDDDDEPAPKKKQAPKKKAGGDSKPKVGGGGGGEKQEECKQQ